MSVEAGQKKGVVGAAGAALPADAPVEVSQPVRADGGGIVVYDPVTRQPTGEIVTPAARAAENERELQPLKPPGPPLTPEQKIAQLKALGLPLPHPAVLEEAQPAANKIRRVARPVTTASGRENAAPTPVAASSGGAVSEPSSLDAAELPIAQPAPVRPPAAPLPGQLEDPTDLPQAPNAGELPQPYESDYMPTVGADILEPLTDADRARMPAASETDSPSRGIPKTAHLPKDKRITGGFADTLEAQYYPLDGLELKQLILGQFDTLAAQLESDLRFSMALVYPRIRAKITIEIEGDVEDSGFRIPRVIAPLPGQPGSTPEQVAAQFADRIVFVVQAVQQEFDAAGDVDQPPDAIRDALGLPKPGKRMILSGGRRLVVDVTSPNDIGSVTR